MVFIVSSLNVDSIVGLGRRNDLHNFLNSNHVDLCLVQETKLEEKIKFKFGGYNIIRNDNIRGRGGTAIMLRDTISIRNPEFINDRIQANSIEIWLNNSWHKFTSAYFPPGLPLSFEFIHKFFQLHIGYFIGGDLNGRNRVFGDKSDNTYGIHILNSINSIGGAIINPPSPTCFHCTDGSYIDKFVNLSNDIPNCNINLLPSFSDHMAISISIPTISHDLTPPIITLDYEHVDMDKFNKYLELHTKRIILPLHENITPTRADQIACEYNDIIQNALNRYVPKAKTHHNSRVILSANTKLLQAKCRNLQRKLSRNKNAQFHIRRQWINDISHLRIMIRNSCACDMENFFSNAFNNIETHHDAFRIIKNFTGHKKREQMGGFIYLNSSETLTACGTENIANSLGRHFASNNELTADDNSPVDNIVCSDIILLNSIDTSIQFSNQISPLIRDDNELGIINSYLPPHQCNILTSFEEVTNTINSRPNKKSSGFDNLPFTIIKQFSPINILFLTVLFNHLFSIAHFPSNWKNAIVSGIPKAGKDNSIISNWRPISQLSCISKNFEKIISLRLNHTIHMLGLFQNQYGFLKHNSTNHALAKIQDKINDGLNRGMITTIVAIDLRAAFDVVWRDGLIHKMIKLGFNPIICKIIRSFLQNKSFAVRLNGFISEIFDMREGEPQGSVLSPQLFNVYVNDFPTDTYAQLTQFADDTTVHLTHNNPCRAQGILNRYLTKISDYLKTWKLLLSNCKTELINILGRVSDTNARFRKRANNMKITLNGEILPFSKDIRLLGVQFQTNNLFTKNVKIRIQIAKKAKMALRRLLTNQHIGTKIKTNIYKLYLRSILTFGAPIWCQPPHVSSHQMELLRGFERTCLKNTANIKRKIGNYKHVKLKEIYHKSECIRIDKFITQLHINFYAKCMKLNISKFRFTRYNGGNNRYKPIYYIHKLHSKGRLLSNGKLTLFHGRYNGRPGLVYNTSQSFAPMISIIQNAF